MQNCRSAPVPFLIALSLVALIGAAGLFTTGCQSRARISDRHVQFVDPAEGARLVEGRRRIVPGQGSGGLWIDCRTPDEYRAEHIPGAKNVTFQDLTYDIEQLKRQDVVVVYGNDTGDVRAKAMSKRLMELGHRNVHTLQGGLRAWKSGGKPTVSQESAGR